MIIHFRIVIGGLCGLGLAAGALADGLSQEPNWDEAMEPVRQPRPIGPEPHPFTIEPGRFSIEYSPVYYVREREPGVRVQTWSMPITFKLGVLQNLDVHVGFDPIIHGREDDRDSATRIITSGFGDVIVRGKYNLWGNDGDTDTALAVMPFVQIPTERIDGSRPIAFGVFMPFAWSVWEGFEIDWTPGFAGVRGIDTSRQVFEFTSDVTFNQELAEHVTGFVEFASAITSERGQGWVGLVGAGLTFDVTDDLVIEPAVHFGITSAAEDLIVSLALVVRF